MTALHLASAAYTPPALYILKYAWCDPTQRYRHGRTNRMHSKAGKIQFTRSNGHAHSQLFAMPRLVRAKSLLRSELCQASGEAVSESGNFTHIAWQKVLLAKLRPRGF